MHLMIRQGWQIWEVMAHIAAGRAVVELGNTRPQHAQGVAGALDVMDAVHAARSTVPDEPHEREAAQVLA